MSIVDSLCKIVHAIRGEPKLTDRQAIIDALTEDGILDAPQWMQEFVERIACANYTDSLLQIPTGYPEGENGLINSLLEIDKTVVALGMDDYGEDSYWHIPRLNVVVYIGRECSGDNYRAAVRPRADNLNDWLRGQ